MRSATRAVASVLVAAVAFGTTGTAHALGPAGATPLGVGAARLTVGGLVLLVVAATSGGRLGRALALWRTPVGLSAGSSTALYQVCFFAGVDRTGVAVGTLVTIGSGPVFAGLLAAALLGDRPQVAWVVATALCGLGLVLLTGGDGGEIDAVGILLARTR